MMQSPVMSPQIQKARFVPETVSVLHALDPDAAEWLHTLRAHHAQRFEMEKKDVQTLCEETLLSIARKEAAAVVNGGASQNEFDDARSTLRKDVIQKLKALAATHDGYLRDAIAAKVSHRENSERQRKNLQPVVATASLSSQPAPLATKPLRTVQGRMNAYQARVESESDQDDYKEADGYKYKEMDYSASEAEHPNPSFSPRAANASRIPNVATATDEPNVRLSRQPHTKTSTRHATGRSGHAPFTMAASDRPFESISHERASAAIAIPKSSSSTKSTRPPVTRSSSTFSNDFPTDAGNEGDVERSISLTRAREQRPYSLSFSGGSRFSVRPNTITATHQQRDGDVDHEGPSGKHTEEHKRHEDERHRNNIEQRQLEEHKRRREEEQKRREEEQKRREEEARQKRLAEDSLRREEQRREEQRREEQRLRDLVAAREHLEAEERAKRDQEREREREREQQQWEAEARERLRRAQEADRQKRDEDRAKREQEAEFQRRADEARHRYQVRQRHYQDGKQWKTVADGAASDGDSRASTLHKLAEPEATAHERTPLGLPTSAPHRGSVVGMGRPQAAHAQLRQQSPYVRPVPALGTGTQHLQRQPSDSDDSGAENEEEETRSQYNDQITSAFIPVSSEGMGTVRTSQAPPDPPRLYSRVEATQARAEPPISKLRPIPIPRPGIASHRDIHESGSLTASTLSSSQRSAGHYPYVTAGSEHGYSSGHERSSLGGRSTPYRLPAFDERRSSPAISTSPTVYAERWIPSTSRDESPSLRKTNPWSSVASAHLRPQPTGNLYPSTSNMAAAATMRASWPTSTAGFYPDPPPAFGSSAAAIPRSMSSTALRPTYGVMLNRYSSGRPSSPDLFPVVES